MSATGPQSERFCTFRRYTHAWEVGTGLRVSLAPGRYRVTGEDQLQGVEYICLDETYRIEASQVDA